MHLKLFALSTCSHCRHEREYLEGLKFPYEHVLVDTLSGGERSAAISEVRALNPKLSFPTLLIRYGGKEEVFVGFDQNIEKSIQACIDNAMAGEGKPHE